MALDSLKAYSATELEKLVRTYWKEHKIPQGLAAARKGKKRFFLLDGPPYTNASPHVGHVKTTACKDIWSRFKHLQGFDAYFQPGFDCHGLPTEVMVEKELGIESKGEIEKIGVATFDAKCLEKATNTEKHWIDYYENLGAWRAYFEPYFTFKDYYVESAWWTAKQMHSKGLLIEGEKPIHWCSRCETSLSGYEVSDSYKDLQAPSTYVLFKVKGTSKGADEYLLVWTTTPWTLPANVAVVAHPDETYVRAQVDGKTVILAKKRIEAVEKETNRKFKVLSELKGSELDGMQYEPLLGDLPVQGKIAGKTAHRVYLSVRIMANKKYKKHVPKSSGDDTGKRKAKSTSNAEVEEYEEFVTMDAGTGFVHTAPGHGQTDNFVGRHYNLPMPSPIDEHGKFTELAGPQLAGIYVQKGDKLILEKLENEGKLFNVEQFTHRAAVCWRCKTPLIFRLSPQWYLKVDPLKEKILAANEKINWLPEFGRVKFQNWIADREDWCLSQQRYWGIPMPIWVCTSCNAREVVGSREELKQKATSKLTDAQLSDLHRHTVDSIELKCAACAGGKMKRIKDIFTVWFDSGIAPWASLGYPYKSGSKELFESMFPVDIINESQDQIRGWFDSLMLCSMAAFDKPAYNAVALMGWVVDPKGEKMSKSVGNVVWAEEGISKLGGDAIRLYYSSEVAPWEMQKFSFDQAKKVQQTLSILWNVYTFLDTYRDKQRKLHSPTVNVSTLPLEDQWILSRVNSVSKQVAEHLDRFEFHLAGRAVMQLVIEDLSRTYVKLIRDRLSANADAKSRAACEDTLAYVLFNTSKLIAPICPFISEYIFQQMRDVLPYPEAKLASVHYSIYPTPDADLLNEPLEKDFELVKKVTETANSLRHESKIKLRWPIGEVALVGKELAGLAKFEELLKSFNNCESIKLASKVPAGYASKPIAGLATGEAEVAFSTKRDEALWHKALLREVTRSVQSHRKQTGLVVADRIVLYLDSSDEAFNKFMQANQDQIASTVGASAVHFKEAPKQNTDASLQVEETIISAKFTK